MPSRTGTPDSTSELNAEDRELIDAATSVMARAYNPHSGWHVGAAVRTGDGQIFTGSFFEHATMGQTICAEPAAFIAANMAGHRDIVAILRQNHPTEIDVVYALAFGLVCPTFLAAALPKPLTFGSTAKTASMYPASSAYPL